MNENRWSLTLVENSRHRRRLTGVWGRNPSAVLMEQTKCDKHNASKCENK